MLQKAGAGAVAAALAAATSICADMHVQLASQTCHLKTFHGVQ
jgi:hypothetical protein